jgi:DNA-binding LacI/PurR family transcriptional regulator
MLSVGRDRAHVKTKSVIVVSPTESTRRPRLDDVANEVGVSTATVSLVLRGIAGPSEATRQRVLAASARLGYRPDRAASALASRRSRMIGVLMDISNPFHSQLIEDVYEAAERHGYNLLLSTVTRSNVERRAIETLLDSRSEALILLGPRTPSGRLAALGQQLPIVVVGRPVPSAGVDVVRTDDHDGLGQAVGYLTGLGHRHITYVDGGRGTVPALRRRAYRSAMRRYQVADHIAMIAGGDTEASGSSAARTLMQQARWPTAVITFNDRCAMGLIDTLVRARVDVPHAMSVIGYDDSPIARLAHINLTTVSQNTRQLAEHAVAALIDRLDNGRTDHHEVVVPPHLVQRGTTGPPPTDGAARGGSPRLSG